MDFGSLLYEAQRNDQNAKEVFSSYQSNTFLNVLTIKYYLRSAFKELNKTKVSLICLNNILNYVKFLLP